MTNLCPTCGNVVPDRELIVSLEANTVICNGRSAKLTSQQAEILHILANAAPRVVTIDAIIAGIYGSSVEPETSVVLIRTHICKIRRKIAPLGLTIKNTHAIGYTLQIPHRQLREAA